ncbi:MAG: ribose 5-phosphate isomerase B [Clostridiales bacterium]|nr:ribose 5-phosphate isomerase B [Clostridiales bacterium]
MKIGMGSDHGGYELKEFIKEYLTSKQYEVIDYGTYSLESVDYPDYGEKVAHGVVSGEIEIGIIMCGTGIGISIAANKVKGIRAAVVSEEFSARMAKAHNNANILAMGGRVVGKDLAKSIVDAYLNAEFEGDRHQRRIDKIMNIENN